MCADSKALWGTFGRRLKQMIAIEHVGFMPNPIPYLDGWDLQRRVHDEVVNCKRPSTLLLLEHEAVYTAGKRTEPEDRPSDGTPVIDVDRGGKITWHGPGQLVGYPIFKLDAPLDVVSHVRRLEKLLMGVLAEFGINGYQVEGRSGVWVKRPLGEDKVAAIGVRVARGVTMHGFSLNCDNSLAGFGGIVPCGIRDAGVTTMSEILGRDVTVEEVVPYIERAFLNEYKTTTPESCATPAEGVFA